MTNDDTSMTNEGAPATASEVPQWLQQMFMQQSQRMEEQNQRMNELTTQQTQMIATLAGKIASMEQATPSMMRTSSDQPPATFIPPQPAMTIPVNTGVVQKAKLPHPEKFTGEDKTMYPQFEGMLQAKLEIDGAVIGNEREKVWYAFGRLTDSAAVRIYPWMTYAQRQGRFTVDELFTQMRLAFHDPRHQQKALDSLNRTKQGKRPLNNFLNDFSRLILEAEGWGWDDIIKKGYLKAAISTKLMTAMVGVPEGTSYEEYCSQLRMVSDQLDQVQELTTRRQVWQKKQETSSAAESMDWQATPISTVAVRTKEARWATPEEKERRRRKGECFRCGQEGHRVRDCKTDLNKKKARTKNDTQVSLVHTKKGKEKEDSDTESSGPEDSGKE